MRLREIFQPLDWEFVLTEAEARIQHAEDLVFWEGAKGAMRALNALKSLEGGNHEKVTIKWDGCIHPESIVKTDKGFETIENVIDRVNNNEKVSVLQHNFRTESQEFSPIINAVKQNGKKEWLVIELDNNDVITLTEDHEVYTINRGWIQARDLTDQDSIKDINKYD